MQTSRTPRTSSAPPPPGSSPAPRSPGTSSSDSRSPRTPAAGRGAAFAAVYRALRPLLAAEAAAHAPPGSGIDPADLEQAVWLRLLELGGARPAEPARWVAGA